MALALFKTWLQFFSTVHFLPVIIMAFFLLAILAAQLHVTYRRFGSIAVCVDVFVRFRTGKAAVISFVRTAVWPFQWQHVVFSVWYVLQSNCSL